MFREVWKAVEAKIEKIGLGKAKGEREERRKKKKKKN